MQCNTMRVLSNPEVLFICSFLTESFCWVFFLTCNVYGKWPMTPREIHKNLKASRTSKSYQSGLSIKAIFSISSIFFFSKNWYSMYSSSWDIPVTDGGGGSPLSSHQKYFLRLLFKINKSLKSISVRVCMRTCIRVFVERERDLTTLSCLHLYRLPLLSSQF